MIHVAVVTISDSAVAGVRDDRSGPAVAQCIESLGWTPVARSLVPDERELIKRELTRLCALESVQVVLTTGGTGVALRDITPEATRSVIDREIPGIGEVMRAEGRNSTPLAPLSRGVAGTRGQVLIVNLPGSPKGAVESLQAVAHLISHAVDLLSGKTEH